MYKSLLLATLAVGAAAPASAAILFQQSGVVASERIEVPTIDLAPETYIIRVTFDRPTVLSDIEVGYVTKYDTWCDEGFFCGGGGQFYPVTFEAVSQFEQIAVLNLRPGGTRTPGQDYNYPDEYRGGSLGAYVADGDFETPTNYSFTIASADDGTAVPEPATWAMMLGGFGLAGAAIRQRARKAQHA